MHSHTKKSIFKSWVKKLKSLHSAFFRLLIIQCRTFFLHLWKYYYLLNHMRHLEYQLKYNLIFKSQINRHKCIEKHGEKPTLNAHRSTSIFSSFSFTYIVVLCHLFCHWLFPAKFSCYTFDSYKLLQYPIYPPERQHTPRFPHYTSALTGAERTDQFPFCFNSLPKAIPKGTSNTGCQRYPC